MNREMNILLVVVLLVVSVTNLSAAETVLVEAESFDNLGGWVIDQQSMDQMGSPYVLAHGLGVTVKDATMIVKFSEPGNYRVWVRTRNWVEPWGIPGMPGKFEVLINNKPLDTTFGIEGGKWHWQDGGTVEIKGKETLLILHDLTGFEGRCDAIVFTTDGNFIPPNEGEAMATFRRKALWLPEKPKDAGQFDLVVVGGGMAGMCTAISAARLGLQVALIQDRPVLGGNNSSEIRVHLGGNINQPPYPALGNIVRELDSGRQGNAMPASYYNDGKKLRVVRGEKNIHLFLNMHAFKVEMQGNRIRAVIAKHIENSEELRFPASLFADCTGDGAIGYLVGADYRYGREGEDTTSESFAPQKADRMVLGMSVMWYSGETETDSPFPDCEWALQFNEETYQNVTMGEWDWEVGMNRNQITEFEQIRDYGLRVIYGNWAFQKNHSRDKAKYANRKLEWVAYIGGKRESRRLLGDVILQQQDIQQYREFPDASVTTTWSIDLHYPQPENSKYFPGAEFRSICSLSEIKPYPIPYRCLYSRNIGNLLMAGRNISVTHVALGTIRVMRTTGMMGEVIGMAASLCKKHNTSPRGVYENHLEELKGLMTKGAGLVEHRDKLTIDGNLAGGNIIIDRIDGNNIYLRQDLRDTEGWWFYWNFRVRGAGGRKLKFPFDKPSPIGVRGPAVSKDSGHKWAWLGVDSVKDASFSYEFSKSENDIRFCFAMPYQQKDMQLFLKSIMPNPNLIVEEHARTKAGRIVQRFCLGKINGEPKYKVLLTCRHHACESMASFVLEGMIEHILTDTEDSKWFCDNVEVMAVPFMDIDGVEEGDQGKNRKPHDHNRDYSGKSIYNSVRQLRNKIPSWSKGKLKVALDLHCPGIRGDDHEKIYLVGNSDSKVWLEQTKFSSMFESIKAGPLGHKASNNIPFGQSWNTGENEGSGKSCSSWASQLEGIKLATTIEISYANVRGATVTSESARLLGYDFARTLRIYLEQLD